MKAYLFLIALSISIWSCSTGSTSSGEKFIGKWKLVNSSAMYQIDKNGTNFIVIHKKKVGDEKYVGIYDEKTESIQVNAGFAATSISYLPSQDQIIISGIGEFDRIKE